MTLPFFVISISRINSKSRLLLTESYLNQIVMDNDDYYDWKGDPLYTTFNTNMGDPFPDEE